MISWVLENLLFKSLDSTRIAQFLGIPSSSTFKTYLECSSLSPPPPPPWSSACHLTPEHPYP